MGAGSGMERPPGSSDRVGGAGSTGTGNDVIRREGRVPEPRLMQQHEQVGSTHLRPRGEVGGGEGGGAPRGMEEIGNRRVVPLSESPWRTAREGGQTTRGEAQQGADRGAWSLVPGSNKPSNGAGAGAWSSASMGASGWTAPGGMIPTESSGSVLGGKGATSFLGGAAGGAPPPPMVRADPGGA